MLYMIRTFPFCSMSHQQAIQILNSLKEAFDADDLTTLKAFVKRELGKQDTAFSFPSGFKTAGMNMGQIIQIAFELRNITQQALDDMSSDDEEENNDEAAVARRLEMSSWFKFCKEKVDKIEKVWNKKLEDPKEEEPEEPEDDSEADKKVQQEKDQYEAQLQEMFANFGKRNLSKSFSGPAGEKDADIQNAADAAKKGISKDDADLVPKFADN